MRKRADQMHAELAAIVKSSDDAIIGKTLDGCVTSWNAGAERLFGYSAAEAIGRPVTFLIPPDRIDEEAALLARLSRGERVEHFETLRRRKDGRLIPVSLSISPIKNRQGRIVGAAKIARDISRRKQIEQGREEVLAREREARTVAETLNGVVQLLAAELDLQALLQKVTDAGATVTEAEMAALFYNAGDEPAEGYALYALSGLSQEAFDAIGMPRHTRGLDQTFRAKRVLRLADTAADPGPDRHRLPQGGPEDMRSYLAVPVTSRSGEVLGGLLFGHREPGRFTERAERLALGIAAQGAIAIDNARLYARATKEIAARKQAEERIAELLEQEKAARQEAEKANRMKDEFLATVSHELRTPLSGILGWAQLLLEGGLDQPNAQRAVSAIERGARTQGQLVNDLLDMSRIMSGKLGLHVQAVDLSAVVRATVDTVRVMAEAKDIALTMSLGPHSGRVKGDPDRLQQVLWNLLTNAIKYTPRGGRVSVRLTDQRESLRLHVEDNGQGISRAYLPHVFDRFSQGDASSTRRQGGLGLGLSLVKYLTELHGGVAGVESLGEGQGATFTVTLPKMAPSEDARWWHAPPVPGVAAQPPSLSGVRVLVMDDERDVLDLLSTILTREGAEVRISSSARETLDLLDTWQPQVLLCDIAMPDEDGYSMIRRIRSRAAEEGGEIPAVAVTAYARSEDRSRALKAGYQGHVPKPFTREEILSVVANLTGKR